jgi:hypothetical protein
MGIQLLACHPDASALEVHSQTHHRLVHHDRRCCLGCDERELAAQRHLDFVPVLQNVRAGEFLSVQKGTVL